MGPNSDTEKGTLYINGGTPCRSWGNQNSVGSGAVRLSADFDRCFFHFHNGLPEMVAAEAGVVVLQGPVEGAGRGNPSEVEGLEQMMEQM